ncbi:MAG: formylglycine-generating enzyme family protein [Chloroflexi bacterium]|nr:formylglycine-generating enzyme family protein [Chloroflexota bacterium]
MQLQPEGGAHDPGNQPRGPAQRQPYGLYHHMAGNVWECRLGRWAKPYDADERTDPQGTFRRVLRGGSFYSMPQDVRCSVRCTFISPLNWGDFLGLRVVVGVSRT